MQLGYVVDDLDAALAHWTQVLGVGPFFVAEGIPMDTLHYRGTPIRIDQRVAIAQDGPVQVELLQQTGGDRSCFTDFLAARGPGLHHVCVLCEDFDATIEDWAARGVGVLQGGKTATGLPFAYMDTDPAHGGQVLEIVPASRGLMRYFTMVAEAAEGWDGTDPVRRVG
ncbi:VOC family protein [Roseibacterium sp. SDUM158016]|uniref:VOC family protein n=1 Tax=Roseicyclus sediminis TaxID=2980997 RepID=UPI0021D05185|nr:VOC family protein [Roseibacterium sp. SDUM158016]MCU4652105.1 VOC family protein [Roseibacterium sp. SDUM158016]